MRIPTEAITWLRRIADVALVALVVSVLLAVATGRLVPLTGRQSIVIGGGSMEPAIHLGSAVVVTPVVPAALAVGDVVSLQVAEAHAVYTHRIVGFVDRADGRWIRTKGDANEDLDPTLVPASAVIGRVDLVVPWIGYLMSLLMLPTGFMFVVGLAGMLLAIAWLLESLDPAQSIRRGVSADRPAGGAIPPDPSTHEVGPPSLTRPTARDYHARSRALRRHRARWPLRGLAHVGGRK